MNDDFDDFLRSRLRQSDAASSADAHGVLGELRPAMRRARIRRTVAVGTATLSLLGVGGIGLAAVTTSLRQDPSEVDILVEGDPLPEPTPNIELDERDEVAEDVPDRDATVAPSTSLPATTSTSAPGRLAPVTTQPTSGNVGENAPATTHTPITQPVDPTTSAPPITVPPSSPATTTPVTTAAAPTTTPTTTSTTTSTTTAPAPSGQRTVQSNCGSIKVSYSGNSITLTDTQPASGFAPDIKNSGPEKVEVGFSNGSGECEIKARVESGELRIDVDNHEDDEQDDGAESEDD